MADSFTPYWQLCQPEIGASRDTWGTKLNTDLQQIDTLLQALQPIGAMTDFAGIVAPTGWLLCDGSIYPIASYPRLFAAIVNRYGGDGVSTFAVPDARGRATYGAGSTVGDYGYTFGIGLAQRLGDWQIPVTQANLPSTSITTSSSGLHGHPGSITDIQGNHVHTGGTSSDGDHSHTFVGVNFHNGAQDVAGGFDSGINANSTTSVAGIHSHTFSTTVNGDHYHNLQIATDGNHNHTFSLGGSDLPLRIVPPLLGTTKIICCGPPSMQSLAGITPAGALRLMASPLRGMN